MKPVQIGSHLTRFRIRKKTTLDLRLETFSKNINIYSGLQFRFKITNPKAAVERQTGFSLVTISYLIDRHHIFA